MKRALSLLLALLFVFGATACNQKPGNTETTLENTTPTVTTPEQTTPEQTTPEQTTPEQTTPEQTTPEQTTPEQTTPPPEIVDPPVVEPTKVLSSVTVVLESEDAAVQTAADELKKHLAQKGVSVLPEGGFPIHLVIDASLGQDCYKIVGAANVDETAPTADGKEFLNIIGGNGRGVIYGIVRFLEDYAGVRFFHYELTTYYDTPVAIPTEVLVEFAPVFEYRYTNWYSATKEPLFAAMSGLNGNHGGLTEEFGGHLSYAAGYHVHTIAVLTESDYPYPGYAPNPCLTDPEVLATAIRNVRAVLEEQPTANILSVSQTDNETHCECANCMAVEAEEGSPAGVLLRFVNAIANDIAEDYPNVTIDTLAYKYTQAPPKITKPAKNVCIRLCSIKCHFNHVIATEDCSTCTKFRNDLAGWSEICDNIYVWDYTTNFSFYLSFFANLHVLRGNAQLFADYGVKGLFEQGNSSGPSGEFGELRAYLLSKLLMDPYMSEEEYNRHMDEFLAAYYGAGWENIRTYIDQLSSLANAGEPQGIYHRPTISIAQKYYEILENAITAWWDAAERDAGDRLEYVQRSRLQWRYMQLILNPNAEIAKPFVEDVEGWGVAWREGLHYISKDQDLSIRPDNWTFVKNKPT